MLTGPPSGGNLFLHFLILGVFILKKNELSIFIDETGDYGTFDVNIRDFSDCFYIVALVFHEQNKSIEKQLVFLNNRLQQKDFNFPMTHCGPLIEKNHLLEDIKVKKLNLFYMMWFVLSKI